MKCAPNETFYVNIIMEFATPPYKIMKKIMKKIENQNFVRAVL